MRLAIAALGGLLLSGCASVAGNQTGGVVENASSAKGAMAKADAHCASNGRAAKAMGYDALLGSLTFECVAK